MKIAITESENFSSEAINLLSKTGEVFALDCETQDALIENCTEAEAIFIRLKFRIDRRVLDSLPKLKFILSATTGTDHIDMPYFLQKGGEIICLKGETKFLETIPSTAEHTWGLLLALLKKIPSSFDHVKQGIWNRNLFKGNNLKNKKIAILGMGRVGEQVARYAECFDMEVGFYDIVDKDLSYKKFETAAALFQWADIISIHIPLNESNKNYIDKDLLCYAKIGVVLINTSRGGVWDENVIAENLYTNKIYGIAVDVLGDEFDVAKITANPLIALAKKGYNIIITPHVSGATFESMAMTEDFIAQKFVNILNHQKHFREL